MLRLVNVSHIYENGVEALSNCSLEIPKGMFGLLGPNGAGKSSLMRCIATLQTPTLGNIYFDNFDVTNEPLRLRAQLGYLPQDFGVYPRISAYRLLEHLVILKGIVGKEDVSRTVEGLLTKVNLWNDRNKAVIGFSGGMRQRFGIAQALIGNPKLIVLDEPTAGLDPEERQRFNNFLSEIGEQVVVILSTHIVQDVLDLCPKMATMYKGRILQTGSPSELIAKLENRVWRCTVEKSLVSDYKQRFPIFATRLRAGQTVLSVVANEQPAPEFESFSPNLDDVYFSAIYDASLVSNANMRASQLT
jgi:ABC-2 type transport system ATP-binding protein